METKQEVIEAIKKFKQERQLPNTEKFFNTIIPQRQKESKTENPVANTGSTLRNIPVQAVQEHGPPGTTPA